MIRLLPGYRKTTIGIAMASGTDVAMMEATDTILTCPNDLIDIPASSISHAQHSAASSSILSGLMGIM
jgi:cation transport ATPase